MVDLTERPEQLDAPDEPPTWPFGDDEERGRLLSSFTSAQLLAKRHWLERHNKTGDLTWLIEELDGVLSERGGL